METLLSGGVGSEEQHARNGLANAGQDGMPLDVTASRYAAIVHRWQAKPPGETACPTTNNQ